MNELEEIKEQHLNNYKKAVLQIVQNNTKSLVEDDIMLLVNKPPLDSMDVIKSKFLEVAKKEKIVVNTEEMEKLISTYRSKIGRDLKFIKKLRIEKLEVDINKFKPMKDFDVIRITKKQLSDINKKINSDCKKIISDDVEKLIIKKFNTLFILKEEEVLSKKINNELVKFFKSTYQKQLLENISFKVLVKDTTLINGVREQAERYIFTITNSRFKEFEKD